MNKSFTLVESLVVIAIIVILSVIIIPNYYSTKQQLALQRSAFKLAQDIRKVQEMAMSAKEFEGEIPEGGYGIFLRLSVPTSYFLFPDIDKSYSYSSEDDDILEQIEIETGIIISGFNDCSAACVVFTQPDPLITINNGLIVGSPPISCPSTIAVITLCIEGTDCSDPTNTKTITVNKAGLVYID